MIQDITNKTKNQANPDTIKGRLKLCMERHKNQNDNSLARKMNLEGKSFFNKNTKLGKENNNFTQNAEISPRYANNFIKNGQNLQNKDATPKSKTPITKNISRKTTESDFDSTNNKVSRDHQEVMKTLFNGKKSHNIFEDIRKTVGSNNLSNKHTISKNSLEDFFSKKNQNGLENNYFSIDVSQILNNNTEQDFESVNKYNTTNTSRKIKPGMFKEGDQNFDFYNNFFDNNSLYHPNFYKNILCINNKKKQPLIGNLN